MKMSTEKFNAAIVQHQGETVVLTPTKSNYAMSQQFDSKYGKYHLEFWNRNGEMLYACIHTEHIDSEKIFKFATALKEYLPIIKWTVSTIPVAENELSGNTGPAITHTINYRCRKGNPNYNADLLNDLVKYADNLIKRGII